MSKRHFLALAAILCIFILISGTYLVLAQDECLGNHDCISVSDTDIDGSHTTGDNPETGGTCTEDMYRCVITRDTSYCDWNNQVDRTEYSDFCSGDTLTEYFMYIDMCDGKTYDCNSYGPDECVGSCPGCSYKDWSCKGSGTTSNPSYCGYDVRNPDDASAYCSGCLGAGYWNLGGEVAATTCCGDDNNENKRGCSIGGTNTPESFSCSGDTELCCNAASDCTDDGGCYADGKCRDDSVCVNGAWQDQDNGDVRCAACQGTGHWDLGGEASSADDLCCGDDSSEYVIAETGGTDAPSGYNDGTTTCCDNANDCAYTFAAQVDYCIASGRTSSRGVPNKAYCNAGTWEGGDAGSTQCSAIAPSGGWNVGGSGDCTGNACLNKCCGDDNGEKYQSRTCSSGCTSSSSDDTCCDNANDCVYNGVCYSEGSYCAPWNSDVVGSCSSGSWSLADNCLTKSSVNSGDSGDAPGDYGSCIDYDGCSGASCTSTTYNDICTSSTQLTEYYASGASCPSKTYTCSDFEAAATGDTSDDPTSTGTCTAGTGATCSSGAFSTTSGSSGTEGCIDPNACPGGANCVFREYYATDSGDACPGLDTCASKTYDPDTNPNTCQACLGSGRYDIGGIAGCCGDDNSEYVQSINCDAYLTCPSGDACCDQTSDCVWNNACYNNGANHPSLGGVSCVDGIWKDTTAPVTSITPDGGDFTGQSETSFTLTCSDTGGSDCSKTYYKIINDGEACGTTGFTDGNSGDVTCPFGQTCDKRVCYYSTDNAGNQEAVKQSNIFHLETNACMGKQCGEACLVITGVCDGDWGNCYTEGGCLLNCSEPSLGPGDQRIWANQDCGRTGSYKCGETSVCSNSYTSCTAGGTSTQVTASWSSYTPPSGSYKEGDTFQIRVNGISNQPSGFSVLTECMLIKPNGNVVYFDNWGSGNILFSYTIQATDPEGVWTIDYCGLWSDFLANDGWELQMNQTNFTFIVDKTPPSITINSPAPGFYISSFLVNATATDAWSEVAGVSYRWENGTDTGQWTSMPRQTGTDFFTANFDASGLADGDYTIRVKANDTLGHEIEDTVDIMIDATPPDITINMPSPNTWYKLDFTVTATVTEEGSGVSSVVYRWENSTSVGSWVLMTDNHPTFTSPFAISSVKGGLYTFRVKANDTLGSESNESVQGVGIDDELPSSRIFELPDFTIQTKFNISWEGSDNESGIDCYVIQYRYNDTFSLSEWENLTINGGTCTDETETEFDATGIASDPNKYTFYFRSLAKDNAGNWETKTAEDTKTMIFIPVLTNVYAFDPLTGFVIPDGGKASANRPIFIIAENKSPDIGPLNFTLTYYNHTTGSNPLTGKITTDTKNNVYYINLTAGPYQGYKMQVSYYVEAWNGLIYERSPPTDYWYFTMYDHPLANFVVTGTLQTRLGRTELVGIEVRNIQTKYDEVSLELDSEYARFVENGMQNINIPLNPQEEKIVYARLYPPGLEGYILNLDAHSLVADPTLDDADTIRIAIFMPPEFPGLSNFAVVLLLIMAVLIYAKFVRSDN